jgi:HTH-type transcriptional regulator/antitoxin HigA
VETAENCVFALDLVEHLVMKAEDPEGEPLLHMIDMIAEAIEKCENSLEAVRNYISEVETLDLGVSALNSSFAAYSADSSISGHSLSS